MNTEELKYILEFPLIFSSDEYFIKPINIHEKITEKGKNNESPITIEIESIIGDSLKNKLEEWLFDTNDTSTGRMGYAYGYKKNLKIKIEKKNGKVNSYILIDNLLTKLDLPMITVHPKFILELE